MSTETRQREHYDTIGSDYEAHYDDATSQRYRDTFINDALFEGIDLRGLEVLEGMCGSGQTTRYLVERDAVVSGLDISGGQIESFTRRWPQCRGIRGSMTDSGLPDASFDCVVVVGGLHHVHPQVKDAVREIHRVLRPGGHFCFMEPHARSLPDTLRQWWYARDPLFQDNEAAIDVERLAADFDAEFTVRHAYYRGNVAYMLVYNSMVFRIPVGWKRYYAPPLHWLEHGLQRLQSRASACIAVCQWQKNA